MLPEGKNTFNFWLLLLLGKLNVVVIIEVMKREKKSQIWRREKLVIKVSLVPF